MIELNKEYTIIKICETLEWEYAKGNRHKAIVKEIESCFEFYHPENKKTHKPKKSYIFTKQLKEPVEPSRQNNGKQSNDVIDFYDYICSIFNNEYFDEWCSSTTWYCDILNLLEKEVSTDIYNDDEVIKKHCEKLGIHNWVLYKDYIGMTRRVLKDLLFKALNYGKRKHTVSYSTGYKFIYALGERSKGTFVSDNIDDKVKQYETEMCDEMNERYNLSNKMKGRQLLMLIYGNEAYAKELKDGVCVSLMDDGDAMCEFDDCLSDQCEHYISDCCSVDDVERPLLDYHPVTMISDIDDNGNGNPDFATDIVRKRVRKQILNAKDYRTKNKKYFGKSVLDDVLKIEKTLFVHFDETYVDDMDLMFPTNALTDDEIAELDELFSVSQNGNADDWGEQIDFSVEEILDMPTVCEVQPHLAKKGSVANSVLHGEVDKPTMDSEQFSQKSSTTDDRPILSEEEAWELFA